MVRLAGLQDRWRRFRGEVTHTDPLTGLGQAWTSGPDGRVFRLRTAPWPSPVPRAAVFVGLDVRDMVELNAAHGHRVGDRVLAELGARLRRTARPWPAYRTGGEELLVVDGSAPAGSLDD